MKLMSYNILDGAVKTLPKIIEIVKQEEPDYLTLNEANTFARDNNKILIQFAKKTAFQYFDIALSGQYDYHVAVFSKYPLRNIKKLQPLARACLIALVDTPFGEVSIASLHLTPHSEDMRNLEIDRIVNTQKEYKYKILMGDMNSLSKVDDYPENIINTFNEIQMRKFTYNGKLRFEAIEKILSVGYYDSAVEMNKNKEFTAPTPSNIDPAHSNMRLDYIFISKSLLPHLRSYQVIVNDLTDIASDHYPVSIELE